MKKLFPKMDCFLDMDGVLVNMHRPVLAAYDMESRLSGDQWPMTTNRLNEVMHPPIKQEDLWRKVNDTKQWWSELEPYEWHLQLVNFLHAHFQSVRILTHPQDHEGCYAGKLLWLHAHLPRFIKIIYAEEKWLLGCQDRFLIDDTPSVVRAWRKTGGAGIVFPQTWNTRSDAKNYPFASTVGCLMAMAEKKGPQEDWREPWEIFLVESHFLTGMSKAKAAEVTDCQAEPGSAAMEINKEAFMRP